MTYLNFPSPTPIFPALPPLTWSVTKKPIMASDKFTAVSGREFQLARAVFPRWEFTLSYGGDSWLRDQTQNITADAQLAGFTEFEQLCGLFIQCLGSYGEFFYSDPDDNSRYGVNLGNGNGTLIYPIFYSWGVGPFSPNLTIPVGGVQSLDAVYIDGVLVSPLRYSLSSDSTSLIFQTGYAPSPSQTLTIDLHFYFRCRFLQDMQNYSQWAKNLWENQSVQFQSVKP